VQSLNRATTRSAASPRWFAVGAALLLLGTSCESVEQPPSITSIYATELGGPVQGIEPDQLAAFERGREGFQRLFAPSEGLGPNYNATSCVACHFFPVPGGAASRFRDVHLLQGGSGPEDLGTEDGPLLKLYSVTDGHAPPSGGFDIAARRAPLSALGIGLFSFVPDEEILSRADPDDADGDGISGRAHRVDGEVGRFGYKAQAADLEHVVRAALREQLGLTSEAVPTQAAQALPPLISSAHAHPNNPLESPSSDSDAIADPELGASEIADLVAFLTWLGPPAPSGPGAEPEVVALGEQLFGESGCARCHTPTLNTGFGPIPAYTDLLLHDMGSNLGPDVAIGDASTTEFRTTPLLAVRLHVPYLHDSSAPAYEFTMFGHGGEAAASAAAYEALDDDERGAIQFFLDSLGGWNPKGKFLAPEGTPVPEVGAAGGPDRELTPWEVELWKQGREKFDRMTAPSFDSGLGTFFNADTCRGCHFQPVLGGSGPNDVNVLIVDGDRAAEGDVHWPLGEGTLPRASISRVPPFPLPDSATVVEPRNTPTILGSGLLDRIPAADILALHDPDDADGDGISGRARILRDGRLGRFGWKANVPTVTDFVAAALRGELSMTVDPRFTGYSAADDGDWFADPEVNDNTLFEEGFYLGHLAPPAPSLQGLDEEAVAAGRVLFEAFGCSGCHRTELGGVEAFTDLLLHDVAPADASTVNREFGVLPSEYRTPPLWGLRDTAPYLHDGSQETPSGAVAAGHFGEATPSRQAYLASSPAEQAALEAFLGSL
jgi:CxxC motif-containing protein (DUF1111 family)